MRPAKTNCSLTGTNPAYLKGSGVDITHGIEARAGPKKTQGALSNIMYFDGAVCYAISLAYTQGRSSRKPKGP